MRLRRMGAALAALSLSAGTLISASVVSANAAGLTTINVQDFAPTAPTAIGMTTDPQGNLYIASCSGLYEIAANDPTHTAVPLNTSRSFWCPESVFYQNGYLYVSDDSAIDTSEVDQVSLATGQVQPVAFAPPTGWEPQQITASPDGTLYVTDAWNGFIYRLPSTPGFPQYVGGVGCSSSGLAYDVSSLLLQDYCTGSVSRVSTGGSNLSTAFQYNQFSPSLYPGGQIAVDPLGNAFIYADNCGNDPYGHVIEIPAGTNTPIDLTNVGMPINACSGLGMTYDNGYIYFEMGGGGNGPGDVARFADPALATGETNLVVTRDWTTLTGTWDGAPGAISYTCTLLYGFGGPSSFTTVVRTPTCSFYGLTPSTNFGISVVANYATGSSSAVGAFPLQAPSTIKCVKGRSVVHVRAWNPRCPAHYHRVGQPTQG